ncbi:hypothetical protein HYPSUDRAFT_44056 [Hypholoma sublateritium FD-334 SS-4]|uniref:Uncharacterized protein n=1 Tax=Hypholoma sublateritium (strain FD-334 SS-4) TaxID=945553 RepID=A0A0D2NSZ9_HYPSF|nr:hypothetical protein HYPSUDRAFT_44056 [Hypholoma sublateritium FD-334 SS-4]
MSVEYIASIWDDNAKAWDPEKCPLVVKGHRIPMYLWSKIYKNNRHAISGSTNVWQAAKQNWLNCSYLAKEYLCMGEDNFWGKWSDSELTPDGERIKSCSTTILRGLLKERKVLNASLVREAKNDLDFMQSAIYVKNNVECQVSCPEALARRYKNSRP